MRLKLALPVALTTLIGLFFWYLQIHLNGRYVDSSNNYIDFRLSGKAFTNIGAGGGEMQITYDRNDVRITLHKLDRNPTLRLDDDGTHCCGPGGVFRPDRLRF